MSPLHHPSEDLLFGFAFGRLDRGAALLVDAHLRACPACRGEAARLEAVGGALLEAAPAEAMAPDALARALASLDGRPPEPPPAARPLPGGLDFTDILRDLPLGPKRWLGPGLWIRPIIRTPSGRIGSYLLRSAPGGRLARHGHSGAELTCVLKGAYADETGRYGPGDFAECGPELVHRPVAEPDGECLCLIHAEGPMEMSQAIGRMLQPFIGL